MNVPFRAGSGCGGYRPVQISWDGFRQDKAMSMTRNSQIALALLLYTGLSLLWLASI